jgi:hypothetical protein
MKLRFLSGILEVWRKKVKGKGKDQELKKITGSMNLKALETGIWHLFAIFQRKPVWRAYRASLGDILEA